MWSRGCEDGGFDRSPSQGDNEEEKFNCDLFASTEKDWQQLFLSLYVKMGKYWHDFKDTFYLNKSKNTHYLDS